MVNRIESLLVKKDDSQTFVLYRSVDFSLMIFFHHSSSFNPQARYSSFFNRKTIMFSYSYVEIEEMMIFIDKNILLFREG